MGVRPLWTFLLFALTHGATPRYEGVGKAQGKSQETETSEMSPIKDFCLAYEALNEEGVFSQGDSIAGTVTFTLTEDTKVKGLVVKAKGDARVHWSEGTGDKRRSYNAHRRYFKLKQYLIEEHGRLITIL